MNTIKLNLVISLILEAVKAETFIRGNIDKAANDTAYKQAYHEEAGDEQFHERKLMRSIYTAAEELKGMLGDYVSRQGPSLADNIICEIAEDTDSIVFTLNVSGRFNTAFTTSLARLCSKYIEDKSLMLWWGTFDQTQATYYATLCANDATAISRCFNKTAPRVPKIPFTKSIKLEGDTIELAVGERASITYTIDAEVIDDIEAITKDHYVAKVDRDCDGFAITGCHPGETTAKLFSLHNDKVATELTVKVIEI